MNQAKVAHSAKDMGENYCDSYQLAAKQPKGKTETGCSRVITYHQW